MMLPHTGRAPFIFFSLEGTFFKEGKERENRHRSLIETLYIGRSSNVIIGSCGNFEEVIKSNQSKIICLGSAKAF